MTTNKAACATLARHLATINSGEITRSTVIGLRKALNLALRRAGRWSVPSTAPTLAQTDALEDAISARWPTVVGELHDSGVKLLQSPRYAKRWNAKEAAIIGNICDFRLCRFDRIGPQQMHVVPVYSVRSHGGQSFKFRNIPWQSGGDGPEVEGRDF